MDKLTDIHEALHDAVTETKKKNLVPRTFKVREEIWNAASEICKTNGTTASAYLRKCMDSLVADYSGKSLNE